MRSDEIIQRLARKGMLSHANLLSGNDQEGKQSILAHVADELGVGAPDFWRVRPEGVESGKDISIAQVREVRAFASMSAWASPYKLVAVTDAHCMNAQAQSAFLKLLEEPRGKVVFFLLTNYPDTLLATIRSRLFEFKVNRFDAPKIASEDIQRFRLAQKADLVERFSIAREIANSPERIALALAEWTAAGRALLHEALHSRSSDALCIARTLGTIYEITQAISATNTNKRMALERLMLDF